MNAEKLKKIGRGLAYIASIRAILKKLCADNFSEDFEINTEIGCIENSLNKIKERLSP